MKWIALLLLLSAYMILFSSFAQLTSSSTQRRLCPNIINEYFGFLKCLIVLDEASYLYSQPLEYVYIFYFVQCLHKFSWGLFIAYAQGLMVCILFNDLFLVNFYFVWLLSTPRRASTCIQILQWSCIDTSNRDLCLWMLSLCTLLKYLFRAYLLSYSNDARCDGSVAHCSSGLSENSQFRSREIIYCYLFFRTMINLVFYSILWYEAVQ